jgi:hypothetical protein
VDVDTEVTVARPREQVFDLMADARNEAAWNSKVSRSELVSGEPIGLGTRFLTVNRGQAYDAAITTYDRPDEIVFDVVGKTLRILGGFRFSDDSGSTVVRASFELTPAGYMKVLMPLMAPMIRKSFPKELARFKGFCESR